jgi:hypothetical protein
MASSSRSKCPLLFASYLFYAWWDIRFLSLIVLSTVISYVCSLMISREALSLPREGPQRFGLFSGGVSSSAADTGSAPMVP